MLKPITQLLPPCAAQARHIKRQAEALCIRNQEVQRSCEELLDLVSMSLQLAA